MSAPFFESARIRARGYFGPSFMDSFSFHSETAGSRLYTSKHIETFALPALKRAPSKSKP